jgi:hypothetical protein
MVVAGEWQALESGAFSVIFHGLCAFCAFGLGKLDSNE